VEVLAKSRCLNTAFSTAQGDTMMVLRYRITMVFMLLMLGVLPVFAQERGADDFVQGWSADGRTLFFTTNRNGSSDLYAINRDGTALRALTSQKYVDRAIPSPDGTMLALAHG
jgi:Tol biopolymer transport system component